MKRFIFYAAMAASLLVVFEACRQKPGQDSSAGIHNARTGLDWAGSYTGTIPCADCEGIEISVILNKDNTYVIHLYYIGKENDLEPAVGTFTWSEDGNTVIFSDKAMPYYFRAGENTLTLLDMEGSPITGEHAGMYVLHKTDQDREHNAKNSLNWEGNYTGEIPCADCPGINVRINLGQDETYKVEYTYTGRKDAASVITVYTGKFSWDDNGSIITLDSKDIPPHYKVGENRLIQLDMEGKPVEGEHAGMYVLHKTN